MPVWNTGVTVHATVQELDANGMAVSMIKKGFASNKAEKTTRKRTHAQFTPTKARATSTNLSKVANGTARRLDVIPIV